MAKFINLKRLKMSIEQKHYKKKASIFFDFLTKRLCCILKKSWKQLTRHWQPFVAVYPPIGRNSIHGLPLSILKGEGPGVRVDHELFCLPFDVGLAPGGRRLLGGRRM